MQQPCSMALSPLPPAKEQHISPNGNIGNDTAVAPTSISSAYLPHDISLVFLSFRPYGRNLKQHFQTFFEQVLNNTSSLSSV